MDRAGVCERVVAQYKECMEWLENADVTGDMVRLAKLELLEKELEVVNNTGQQVANGFGKESLPT